MPETSDDIKLEILNLALGHLGEPPVTSLAAAQKGALLFARFYPRILKVVLCGFPWKFATKTAALVLTAVQPTTPHKYALCYDIPTDCLRVRSIVYDGFSFDKDDEVKFDREGAKLWTDVESAVAVYTENITDCLLFDHLFTDHIAKYLAVHLAMPLTGKPEVQQSMLRLLQLTAPHAEATSAAERSTPRDRDQSLKGSRA